MRLYLVGNTGHNTRHTINTFDMYAGEAIRGVNPLTMRILLSYHYFGEVNLDELFEEKFVEPYPEVFGDSGAFSAKTRGVKIDIDDYIRWITEFGHLITCYTNLDVLGDHKKTKINQKIIEEAGLRPIPVFHVGSPFKVLDEYLERYNLIGLGAMVPHAKYTRRLMPWLIKCFKMAKGRGVFHGFGLTNWTTLKSLPWFSVDSTSWGKGFRFGRVPVFDYKNGRFRDVQLGKFEYPDLIREFGFEPEDFADRGRNTRSNICTISALSYMVAEVWLREVHGEVELPDRDVFGPDVKNSEGLNLYLAEVTSDIFDNVNWRHRKEVN